MGRVADGDSEAFASIYQDTAAGVFRAAQRVVRDARWAEDVTQDVFLYLWQHARRYDPCRGLLESWLHTIAHHRAVDLVRSHQRRYARECRYEGHDAELEGADVALLEGVAAGVVREALAQLPPHQRAALRLAYFDDHTHAEIAELLDTPLGTVKTRIRDAKIRLHRLLDEHSLRTAS